MSRRGSLEHSVPSVSFMGIVDFSSEAHWLYASQSSCDLLGYEPHELIGTPSLNLVHPYESDAIRRLHYETIHADKAAAVAYLRMKHKDPLKGYILCAVSRTIVYNVVVGSVSLALPGAKAMQTSATAREISIISPTAIGLQYRRWDEPSPMPPTLVVDDDDNASVTSTSSRSPPPSPSWGFKPDTPLHYGHLPDKSLRTALILSRFTNRAVIEYCSNDVLVTTTDVMGRSFYDFVALRDEETVRKWIDGVKTWGVNDRGQPSDGGFGFGTFKLLKNGRDSQEGGGEPPSAPRHRSDITRPNASRPRPPRHYGEAPTTSRPRPAPNAEQIKVDAIFSPHSDGIMVILRLADANTEPRMASKADAHAASRSPQYSPSVSPTRTR